MEHRTKRPRTLLYSIMDNDRPVKLIKNMDLLPTESNLLELCHFRCLPVPIMEEPDIGNLFESILDVLFSESAIPSSNTIPHPVPIMKEPDICNLFGSVLEVGLSSESSICSSNIIPHGKATNQSDAYMEFRSACTRTRSSVNSTAKNEGSRLSKPSALFTTLCQGQCIIPGFSAINSISQTNESDTVKHANCAGLMRTPGCSTLTQPALSLVGMMAKSGSNSSTLPATSLALMRKLGCSSLIQHELSLAEPITKSACSSSSQPVASFSGLIRKSGCSSLTPHALSFDGSMVKPGCSSSSQPAPSRAGLMGKSGCSSSTHPTSSFAGLMTLFSSSRFTQPAASLAGFMTASGSSSSTQPAASLVGLITKADFSSSSQLAEEVAMSFRAHEERRSTDIRLQLLDGVTENTDQNTIRKLRRYASKLIGRDEEKNGLLAVCAEDFEKLTKYSTADIDDEEMLAVVKTKMYSDLRKLIEKQLADSFLEWWALDSHLPDAYQATRRDCRFVISTISAILLIGVAEGKIHASQELKYKLVRTWIVPLCDDFGMIKQNWKMEETDLEQGICCCIFTQTSERQQELLNMWYEKYNSQKYNSPNILQAYHSYLMNCYGNKCKKAPRRKSKTKGKQPNPEEVSAANATASGWLR